MRSDKSSELVEFERRVDAEPMDSLDEEREMQTDDERMDALVAEVTARTDDATDRDRRCQFKEPSRLQGGLVKPHDWVAYKRLRAVVLIE